MQSNSAAGSPAWKRILADLVTDPEQLCRELQLDELKSKEIIAACAGFPLKVPRPYLSRIKHSDMHDPLLLQVLPQTAELRKIEGFQLDPLREQEFCPVPGLLHKYHGRVLIVLSGSCAIHCRYCFRRHFPYQDSQIDRLQWRQIIEYINADPSISEVILSGGEPLNSTDAQLSRRCQDLASISHLKRLRIHTRQPIMIPQRIDASCLAWMKATRLEVVMVIHSNHAQEIDKEVETALQRLRQAGVCLLNQSVLLKGINDRADILAQLSERLFECGVLPYYLHLLDSVQGAAHFAVPRDRSMQIKLELQAILPGYLVPRFAVEEAHSLHKTTL